MNPNDYYRLKSGEIREADIRLVAACMSDHVGEENAVRLETLVARCGLGERQVRDILETPVIVYGWPVCAHAGKAGRWLATNEDDRWLVIGDLDSRIRALRERREAMLTAKMVYNAKVNKEI